MNKLEGWEKRLNLIIESYLVTPFEWGKSDCLLFVADCINALSGIDIMADWRETYNTEESAYEMLGDTPIESAFSDLKKITNNVFCQRGDVGILNLDDKKYCGIISFDGKTFLLRSGDGLKKFPINNSNIELWRVE